MTPVGDSGVVAIERKNDRLPAVAVDSNAEYAMSGLFYKRSPPGQVPIPTLKGKTTDGLESPIIQELGVDHGYKAGICPVSSEIRVDVRGQGDRGIPKDFARMKPLVSEQQVGIDEI